MRTTIRRQIAALILVLATVLGANAVTPVAVGAETTACASELKIKDAPSSADAAVKTPVILVRGWQSENDTWSKAGMDDAVAQLPQASVVDVFDYKKDEQGKDKSNRWVTDGDTAQRLAKTIVCYSRLYGDKKVIIVAHSMGGLLARAALDWAAYGTFARNVTGHVITIGTPHEGALMANAGDSFWMALCKAPIGVFSLTADIDAMCHQANAGDAISGLSINSDQLAQLPQFPSGVSVRAIAGDVSVVSCAVWGCNTDHTDGDLVVSTTSATAAYTSNGDGDGKRVFECKTAVGNPLISDAWCSHNGMLSAPQVQDDVRASIKAYIASVKSGPNSVSPQPAAGGKAYAMDGMTLRLDSDWEVSGGDSNGWTVKTGDIYAGYFNPSFTVGDFSWLGDQSVASYGDFPECSDSNHSNADAKLVRQGERPVGNKRAAYYTAHLCADGAPRDDLFRVWEVNAGGKKVVITTTEWPRYGVTNLDAILAAATWN